METHCFRGWIRSITRARWQLLAVALILIVPALIPNARIMMGARQLKGLVGTYLPPFTGGSQIYRVACTPATLGSWGMAFIPCDKDGNQLPDTRFSQDQNGNYSLLMAGKMQGSAYNNYDSRILTADHYRGFPNAIDSSTSWLFNSPFTLPDDYTCVSIKPTCSFYEYSNPAGSGAIAFNYVDFNYQGLYSPSFTYIPFENGPKIPVQGEANALVNCDLKAYYRWVAVCHYPVGNGYPQDIQANTNTSQWGALPDRPASLQLLVSPNLSALSIIQSTSYPNNIGLIPLDGPIRAHASTSIPMFGESIETTEDCIVGSDVKFTHTKHLVNASFDDNGIASFIMPVSTYREVSNYCVGNINGVMSNSVSPSRPASFYGTASDGQTSAHASSSAHATIVPDNRDVYISANTYRKVIPPHIGPDPVDDATGAPLTVRVQNERIGDSIRMDVGIPIALPGIMPISLSYVGIAYAVPLGASYQWTSDLHNLSAQRDLPYLSWGGDNWYNYYDPQPLNVWYNPPYIDKNNDNDPTHWTYHDQDTVELNPSTSNGKWWSDRIRLNYKWTDGVDKSYDANVVLHASPGKWLPCKDESWYDDPAPFSDSPTPMSCSNIVSVHVKKIGYPMLLKYGIQGSSALFSGAASLFTENPKVAAFLAVIGTALPALVPSDTDNIFTTDQNAFYTELDRSATHGPGYISPGNISAENIALTREQLYYLLNSFDAHGNANWLNVWSRSTWTVYEQKQHHQVTYWADDYDQHGYVGVVISNTDNITTFLLKHYILHETCYL